MLGRPVFTPAKLVQALPTTSHGKHGRRDFVMEVIAGLRAAAIAIAF